MERWRVYVIGYLVWLMALAIVDGAGRKACRMPTGRWIASGADARDRTAREWFRDQARACLDRTPWYAYSMRALVLTGLLAALGSIWIVRRRGTIAHGLAASGVIAAMVGSISLVQWLYDWHA